MATKKDSNPINNNVNNNTNNVNVKVNIEHPKLKTSEQPSNPNWYKRTIIGGIIGLILSLGGYYIKKNIDGNNAMIIQDDEPVIGTKQTKN